MAVTEVSNRQYALFESGHDNAWGLQDMVGNVSEWPRSKYQRYPYRGDDGRNDLTGSERRVARGGSWADRPDHAGSSVRRAYSPWQKVHDVGFRVLVEDSASAEGTELAASPRQKPLRSSRQSSSSSS
ncbi:MAG: SUMF1/EgtB/PvdO family nonheme iron enzyme [Thermoguttaceae bacterium]|nr:SUMF1/EgtB/PvdO family nonheme iron enzyme [Thermoguttaceae bacterium]